VAKILHTELILPEHHQVANAVGAIAGSVMVEEELLVYPSCRAMASRCWAITCRRTTSAANSRSWAMPWPAPGRERERALGAAIRSGADNPQVTVQELTDG